MVTPLSDRCLSVSIVELSSISVCHVYTSQAALLRYTVRSQDQSWEDAVSIC